ncbi:MAG: glycosyltransferase family 1 protein [Sulfobacillus acidophilus]|uniref:Glycosyltransferase family 1 protein n=1 Tax=Sulfobacillus acidophilus TaxID=53633 RepID=A0A2T2WLF7_9FIRM|nr:MAG: glycosyltransferase family 1 protein [Sulfobacillus acidophilus]
MDALGLDSEASGIGHYIRALVSTYAARYPDDVVKAFVQPNVSLDAVDCLAVAHSLSSRGRIWYEQRQIPRRLRHEVYDVVHFPDYQLPWLTPLPRTVMTVHDLAAFVLPDVFPQSKTRVKQFLMRRSVRLARRIIVPSKATRQDLIDILSVPPEKIRVIPHGVKPLGRPLPERVYARPYFLAVGTVEPRKNFSGLIRAYHLLRERRKDVPDLVIAGRLGWMYEETLALPAKLGVAESVKFLQYVSEEILSALYRDAIALVYPSYYEGFGLPVIEAMQMGLAVITSSTSALAELGENSVWRVDPRDIDSIAQQMAEILDNSDEVARRCVMAKLWAGRLTWDTAASLTRQVYEEAALGG